MLRVPFNHEFENPDPDIKRQLTDPDIAGSAILAWAVKGCLEWQQRGIDPPEAVAESTAEYQAESDPLADFLEESCVVGEQYHVRAGQLCGAYSQWAQAAGLPKGERFNQTAFGLDMAKRFVKKARNVGAVYLGVGLLGDTTQTEYS